MEAIFWNHHGWLSVRQAICCKTQIYLSKYSYRFDCAELKFTHSVPVHMKLHMCNFCDPATSVAELSPLELSNFFVYLLLLENRLT